MTSEVQIGIVTAVNVGKVQRFATGGRGRDGPFDSSYIKTSTRGTIQVWRLGLAGDQHGHPDVHGGQDCAVLMYPVAHYTAWRLEGREFPCGGFGENLSVGGITEEDVCIGDLLHVGTTTLEVSVPRAPCWVISSRWDNPMLLKRVRDTGRIGWLLRVREDGQVTAGDPVSLIARPHPRLTVAHTYAVYQRPEGGEEAARELADCDALAAGWRKRWNAD